MENLRPLPGAFLIIALFLMAVSVVPAWPNGEITETEYSTALSEGTTIVRIIVAVLGGLVVVLGFIVALKGVGGKADIELALSEKRRLSFKKVSQGVVIVIVGAAILVAAVYLLPEKKKERVIKGEEIELEGHGDTVRIITKD